MGCWVIVVVFGFAAGLVGLVVRTTGFSGKLTVIHSLDFSSVNVSSA